MSYNLLQFRSFADFLRYLDNRIAVLEDAYEKLSRREAILRAKAEKIKRLEDMLSKLVGEQVSSVGETDLMGIKIVVGARAVDELAVVEEVSASMKDTITALKRVREIIEKLAKALSTEESAGGEGLVILVETLNEIPIRILMKEGE